MFMFCFGGCVSCGRLFAFSPEHVPSLVVNGEREPVCETCFNRWCEIHQQRIALHPDAYLEDDGSLFTEYEV